MDATRKIIHIDMDAFYASIEQLDNPELQGKPVIVGGRPDSRGVVAACSYEARTFGIHSAMPASKAYRLCPTAVFLRPRMERYREISHHIMEIFRQYTDIVEPLSLDEAFLDITDNKKEQGSATYLAQMIRQQIFAETGLTASAGVSCNKFVAKIASDLNKPNGMSVIEPHKVLDFLASLPIGKFFGVGKVTERKMLELGIRTGADLRGWSLARLMDHFGKPGSFYYDIVRGKDDREVRPSRVRKSLGAERTIKQDTRDLQEITTILHQLTDRIGGELGQKKLRFQTLTLKVRYDDFTTITRSTTFPYPMAQPEAIAQWVPQLLKQTEVGLRKVRLVGLSVSKFCESHSDKPKQLRLPNF